MLKIRQIPMLVCIYRLSNALSNEYSDAKTVRKTVAKTVRCCVHFVPSPLSLNEFLFSRVM